MKLVYLAGPITGQTYDGANDWREAAIARLAKVGIKGLSPLRGKYYLEGLTDIPDSLDVPLSTPKGITTRDRWDCLRCDVLLVNFIGAKRVSIGSCMEIAWADTRHTPIVLAMESPQEVATGTALSRGNVHEHAMIRECAGFILPTLEEALSYVEAILG
jgi:hypothetical protein